jgi:large subunit ribosomal protein L9
MDVILLQKVANLGNIGDRVKVKSGFGRNYLLPGGKATLATPTNVAKFEERRSELEKIARDQLVSAEERQGALKDYKLVIRAKAGTEGKLFGSVGTADISEALKRENFNIARSEVRLPNGALRTIGDHTVSLHLHADVDVPLAISIVAEE